MVQEGGYDDVEKTVVSSSVMSHRLDCASLRRLMKM